MGTFADARDLRRWQVMYSKNFFNISSVDNFFYKEERVGKRLGI